MPAGATLWAATGRSPRDGVCRLVFFARQPSKRGAGAKDEIFYFGHVA
jgi:hypothetical protein